MVSTIRTGQGNVYFAKQTAVGSPATDARTVVQRMEGGIKSTQETGKIKIPDGSRYSREFLWKKRISAEFSYKVTATPEMFALLGAAYYGNSAAGVANGDGISVHTTTSAGSEFVPLTIWETIGSGSQKVWRKIEDAFITSWKLDSNVDADEPVIIEINGFASTTETIDVAPDVTDSDVSDPLTWADGVANFVVDSTTLTGATAFSLEVSSGLEQVFATGINAHSTKFNSDDSGLEGDGACVLDADGLALFNKARYGTATPSTGSSPVSDIFETELEIAFSYGSAANLRSIKLSMPNSIVSFEDDIAFSADGETVLAYKVMPRKSADGTVEALTLTADLPHDDAY